MHWLVGSSEEMQPLNTFWKEVGALKDNNPVSIKDPVVTLLRVGEEKIHLWRDAVRFGREWSAYAPEDSGQNSCVV